MSDRGFARSPDFCSPRRDARREAPARASHPIAATLLAGCEALLEAFVAYHRYERLRVRGIPHRQAIREALGLPRQSADCREALR
jgi:hypothetical protein